MVYKAHRCLSCTIVFCESASHTIKKKKRKTTLNSLLTFSFNKL